MNGITGVPGPFGSANAAEGFTTRRTGWTVGGGVETKLSGIGGAAFNNWSFKAEYLYVDLGNVNNLLVAPVTAGAPTSMVLANSTTYHDHIIRVGVNYSFGGWAH
jgi:outer membrane immunogenic protein